jgi:hypothetical protein
LVIFGLVVFRAHSTRRQTWFALRKLARAIFRNRSAAHGYVRTSVAFETAVEWSRRRRWLSSALAVVLD